MRHFGPYAVIVIFGSWVSPALSQSKAEQPPPVREQSPIEYSRDTVMQRLDNAHVLLNRINIFMDDELDTRKIERQLPAINGTLNIISNSLYLPSLTPEFKNLQLFGVMLNDIGGQLAVWRSGLFKYDKELADINEQLGSLGRDSAILHLTSDSLYVQLYMQELHQLREKWLQANASTEVNLTRIKSLQLRVSKLYFLTVDLKSRTAYLKRRLVERLFRKERPFLWEKRQTTDTVDLRAMAIHSLQAQGPLIGYFIRRNRDSYFCIFLLGAGFFWWAWRISPRILRMRQFLFTMIIILNLHPLFELHASTFPVSQFPLMVVLTILFWNAWSRRHLIYWVVIVLLYVFLLLTRTLLIQAGSGVTLLFLNTLSLCVGYYCLQRLIANFSFGRLVQLAIGVFVLLNCMALVAFLSARISLARIFTTSAIFGVILAIGLSVFASCLLDTYGLQEVAADSKGREQKSGLISVEIKKAILRLTRLYSLVIWLLTLAINLNVYDYLRKGYLVLIDHSFKLGSLSFKLGSLLLFLLILYLSALLQRFIGLIYSVTDDHTQPEGGKKGTTLAMLRLFVIIMGLALAVAASGLPLDKVTIIFGALSVGIGLGMQGIVNNLISGIILVFERPFQIGDFIELNAKKGLVRDIGIRSSRIMTEEGSEVILPNADLLFGQVVNWTVRNRRVKISIPITIESCPPIEEIEAIVQAALADQPGLSADSKPHLLVTAASERSTTITILIWVSNIGQLQSIKSESLSLLFQRFKEKGLRIV
jgi:potassium efflux system protein